MSLYTYSLILLIWLCFVSFRQFELIIMAHLIARLKVLSLVRWCFFQLCFLVTVWNQIYYVTFRLRLNLLMFVDGHAHLKSYLQVTCWQFTLRGHNSQTVRQLIFNVNLHLIDLPGRTRSSKVAKFLQKPVLNSKLLLSLTLLNSSSYLHFSPRFVLWRATSCGEL